MANAVDIVTYLLNDGGSPPLVSGRVYPLLAPHGAVLPNIVVMQISEDDPKQLAGTTSGYPISRVSVISRGATVTDMMNTADDVKAALKDVTHETVNGTLDVTITRTSTDIMIPYNNPDVFEQTTDFMVRFRAG